MATSALVGVGVVADTARRIPAASASSLVSEFQPTVPTKYGGRSISVSMNALNPNEVIVATESGGLFKSTDDGANWSHVDSFPLHRMSDVAWSPNNPSVIIATTWASQDTVNPGGIWRSTNAGATWARVATPAGCQSDFNGWGIDFEPSSTVVYAGSDCGGLLTSVDGGATFALTATPGAGWIHAVVARAGGQVDVCSDAGHLRFTRSGSTLTQVGGIHSFPAVGPGATAGGCPQRNGGIAPSAHDLAGAPQEPNVLFVMKAGTSTTTCGGTAGTPAGIYYLFESDDGGVTWLPPTGGACSGRAPWVRTVRSRSGNANEFDIYYSGGLDVYRATCTAGGSGARCTSLPAAGSPNVTIGHADPSTVAFTTDGSNCARFLVSDGGVGKSTDCGATFPMVAGSGSGNGNFNGLQVYEVYGQVHPGGDTSYVFGSQDNSIYGSTDSGATWPNVVCCEGFNFTMPRSAPAPTGRLTYVSCGPCGNEQATTALTGASAWSNPPGTVLGADAGSPFLLAPTTDTYVQWTVSGATNTLYLTSDAGANWTAVSGATTTRSLSGHLYVTGPASDPTLYQAYCSSSCGIGSSGGLLKITGVNTGSPATVTEIAGLTLGSFNDGNGAFRFQEAPFGVDPNNPLHLLAADVGSSVMKESTDGGATWVNDSQLTNLVTANGRYAFTDGSGRLGTQAHVIYFDPTNGNRIFVGTESAGIIVSLDGGATWGAVPGSSAIPAITSFFHDEVKGRILVSSYGRGLWTIDVPEADLALTKTHRPDPATAGTELYYDLVATNSGPDDATSTVVVDQLAPEMRYVTNTLANPADCSADSPAPTVGQTVTCYLGGLANGASKAFTIKVAVATDAIVSSGPRGIANTATISQLGAGDPDSSDNTATDTVIVEDRADVVVSKLCKPDTTIYSGDPIKCTVFVDNSGPSDARGVVVEDTILSSRTNTMTITSVVSSAGTCNSPVAVTGGKKLVCNLGAIAAGTTASPGRATVSYTINASEGQDIDNLVVARADTPDPNPDNNRTSVALTVTALADLELSKTNVSTATAGTDVIYSLTVNNAGPSTATNVVVEDVVPIGVTIRNVGASVGSCVAGAPGDPLRPTTCGLGTLAPNTSATMTISVHVQPETVGIIHNDARVTSDTFDANVANDLVSIATTVGASADLVLTKVSSPSPVTAGRSLTYKIVATNSGPSTASATRVTDTLPSDTSFVSGVDGNGATICALVQPGSVVCDLYTMAPEETKTIFVTVRVAASVMSGTVLTNNATVNTSTSDPNNANNGASVDTPVTTSADLWLDKQATQRSGNPSAVLVYTLVVHNDSGCETDAQSSVTPNCGPGGPSDARTITVTDHLPLDPRKLVVQYVSPQCTYTKATHTVVCTSPNIPAGATVSFVIEAQVGGSVGSVANTASAVSTTPDPVTTNNSNTATIAMKGGNGKK